jgi:PTH1 family peptidyl-tRNA hydrolase
MTKVFNFLLVGLGNAGTKYKNTRHNIGFLVVSKFCQKHNISLKMNNAMDAEMGSKQFSAPLERYKKEITDKHEASRKNFEIYKEKFPQSTNTFPALNIQEELEKQIRYPTVNLYACMPQTMMNLSGSSVKKCVQSIGMRIHPNPRQSLKQNRILVVVDDLHTPFGQFLMKYKGGDANHNGLKNIEANLNTEYYHRLKMGIGSPELREIRQFVLSNFFAHEQDELPNVIDRAVEAIEYYIHHDINKSISFTADLNKMK